MMDVVVVAFRLGGARIGRVSPVGKQRHHMPLLAEQEGVL